MDMDNDRNNRADIDKYGLSAWFFGVAIAVTLLAIMFFWASPIS